MQQPPITLIGAGLVGALLVRHLVRRSQSRARLVAHLAKAHG